MPAITSKRITTAPTTIRSPKRAAQALVLAGASALLAAALAPSAAQADSPSSTSERWYHPEGGNGGIAESYNHSEGIWLMDYSADGWDSAAQLQVLVENADGSGLWQDFGGVCYDDTTTGEWGDGTWTRCEGDVPEDATYRIHVWGEQDGVIKGDAYSTPIPASLP